MKFSQELRESIAHLHLLKHTFYQDWMAGTLSRETLQEYAGQYYQHVKAFPRYISKTHAQCDNIKKRRILLENLADEEGLNGEDHPELWARFAEGLGVDRSSLGQETAKAPIHNVINTFFNQGDSSYCEGLSALYAYEYQVPEVAETKIEGLKQYYNINYERSLAFFEVHREADKYHRQACEELLDNLNEDEKLKAKASAQKAAQALWDFLSSLQEKEHAA